MANNIQNVYDNSNFFSKYNKMREEKLNANNLIEIPTMKKFLPDLKDKTILDLGCGAGGMSRYFIQKGAKRVLAVDVSKNMLKIAQKHKTKNIEYRLLAMENILEIDEKFDIVFSSLAFHYVKDFQKLMQDIAHLLNKNGMLIFSQENPIATAPILLQGEKKYIEKDDRRLYVLNNYNNNSKRKIEWNGKYVIKYHRNFETVINSIIQAKMNILQILEPTSSKRAVKLVPKYAYQKDRPYFLFVKAQKA